MARFSLWRIFRRSPFGAVQEHMAAVVAATELVVPLFDALIAGDQEEVVAFAKRISIEEGTADDLKNEIRDHLPKGLLLPVARGDVLRQLSTQDNIADDAEDLGVLLTIRPMSVPEWMADPLRKFVKKAVKVVRLAHEVVKELDVLLEGSFGGPSADRVMKMLKGLHLAEHKTDKLQDQLAKSVYAHEDELKPVAVFMWGKILNKIGDLANKAEDVGDRIRLFLAHA